MSRKLDFKRYELKYIMGPEQTVRAMEVIRENTVPDDYAHSSIRNLYFDTWDYTLARRSIEHPLYKEKLRLRSYGPTTLNDKVFVEMKKKFRSVVYKRRLFLTLKDVEKWLLLDGTYCPDGQVGREIDYMKHRYPGIGPRIYLSYERDSFSGENGLRITIDREVKARTTDLSLMYEPGGVDLLPCDFVLMEIKTMYGCPRWLLDLLSELKLYKTTFSKYGAAYKILELGVVPSEHIHLYGGKATQK